MSNLKYSNSVAHFQERLQHFEERLKIIHPHLILMGKYTNFTSKVQVQDKYGVCFCLVSRLLAGAIPCIRTAIDKQSYFLNQVKEVHGNKYDYSKVNYINGTKKIIITCPDHGDFIQSPNHHLIGQGCKKCIKELNLGGWYQNISNLDKKSSLYILEFIGNSEKFMKFGVSVNIKRRINVLSLETKNLYEIKIIKTVENTAKYCYELEQRFKKKTRSQGKQYIPKIKFKGMWECFK